MSIAMETKPLDRDDVFEVLSTAGITSVCVEFDGSGDSGQIESIEAFTGGNPRNLEDAVLRDGLEALCYAHLDEVGLDWYNNDGGYGTFTIHVAERRIELDMNIRFTDSTKHSFEF